MGVMMGILKTRLMLVLLVLAVGSLVSAQSVREQCTSAVILPDASATGGAVVWKNRDTGFLSNKIVFVDEQPHAYLCLANAEASSGRSCWAGLNSEGFGIINTVAYNLPEASGEMKDLEGIIMADALRTCRSVDDFETYIQANLGRELGSLANFAVLDSDGRAVLFEVHNHGYEKIDPAEAHGSCLVNTNFARTGAEGEGSGYLRFERASELMEALPDAPVDFATILTRFTRDTGHVLVEQPTPFEISGIPGDRPLWISTRDTINKAYTSAAVILVGRTPEEPNSVATMWVIPGEPVTAVAVPLWVEAGASPEVLWQGDQAPMWAESARLKAMIRPFDEGNKQNYLNLAVLDNRDGTGYLPGLLGVEEEIIKATRTFLEIPRTGEQYRDFQNLMATKAIEALRSVRKP